MQASSRQTLDTLNAMSAEQFEAALGTVFEDAPWVAAAAATRRPFATVAALHATMLAAVHAAPPPEQLRFLQGHPELSGAAARAGTIGADSTAEQAGLGLQRAAAETDRIAALNAAYRERHGFPFIICVRRHTASSLLRQFERRLAADTGAERETALTEIGHITRLRIVDRIDGPGAPTVHGWLSTHVLDTAKACPAANIPLELWDVGGTNPSLLTTAVTNTDGRTDAPLVAGAPLRIGTYELRFHVGPYFGNAGPGFLDVVPIRFGITEPEAHYHVPLLVSPGGYTTYRGS